MIVLPESINLVRPVGFFMPKTRNQTLVEMDKRMGMFEKGNESIRAELEKWCPLMEKISQVKVNEESRTNELLPMMQQQPK